MAESDESDEVEQVFEWEFVTPGVSTVELVPALSTKAAAESRTNLSIAESTHSARPPRQRRELSLPFASTLLTSARVWNGNVSREQLVYADADADAEDPGPFSEDDAASYFSSPETELSRLRNGLYKLRGGPPQSRSAWSLSSGSAGPSPAAIRTRRAAGGEPARERSLLRRASRNRDPTASPRGPRPISGSPVRRRRRHRRRGRQARPPQPSDTGPRTSPLGLDAAPRHNAPAYNFAPRCWHAYSAAAARRPASFGLPVLLGCWSFALPVPVPGQPRGRAPAATASPAPGARSLVALGSPLGIFPSPRTCHPAGPRLSLGARHAPGAPCPAHLHPAPVSAGPLTSPRTVKPEDPPPPMLPTTPIQFPVPSPLQPGAPAAAAPATPPSPSPAPLSPPAALRSSWGSWNASPHSRPGSSSSQLRRAHTPTSPPPKPAPSIPLPPVPDVPPSPRTPATVSFRGSPGMSLRSLGSHRPPPRPPLRPARSPAQNVRNAYTLSPSPLSVSFPAPPANSPASSMYGSVRRHGSFSKRPPPDRGGSITTTAREGGGSPRRRLSRRISAPKRRSSASGDAPHPPLTITHLHLNPEASLPVEPSPVDSPESGILDPHATTPPVVPTGLGLQVGPGRALVPPPQVSPALADATDGRDPASPREYSYYFVDRPPTERHLASGEDDPGSPDPSIAGRARVPRIKAAFRRSIGRSTARWAKTARAVKAKGSQLLRAVTVVDWS